jgi:hypothetical protein
MCLAQFFGDLSVFQIIVSVVSVVAFLVSIFTFYITFLRGAKVSVYPGDAVRIVVSADSHASHFNFMCNLVNKSPKVGTLHRLEVRVLSPKKITCNFVWNLFYKYQRGGESVEKESDIYPVAVPKMESKLLLVGFQSESKQRFEWPEGRYEFKLIGWVNRKNWQQRRNLKESVFHIQITEEYSRQLNQSPLPKAPSYITVPVIEWERQHR